MAAKCHRVGPPLCRLARFLLTVGASVTAALFAVALVVMTPPFRALVRS